MKYRKYLNFVSKIRSINLSINKCSYYFVILLIVIKLKSDTLSR